MLISSSVWQNIGTSTLIPASEDQTSSLFWGMKNKPAIHTARSFSATSWKQKTLYQVRPWDCNPNLIPQVQGCLFPRSGPAASGSMNCRFILQEILQLKGKKSKWISSLLIVIMWTCMLLISLMHITVRSRSYSINVHTFTLFTLHSDLKRDLVKSCTSLLRQTNFQHLN